jgi:hypothetical protein
MNTFKVSLLFSALLGLLPVTSFALTAGVEGISGGGDLCEDRFKTVAQDLQTWIDANGPAGLILTQSRRTITVTDYSQAMLAQIAQLKITCVSQGDAGYPVMVDGQAKECRSDRDSSGAAHIVS